MHVMHSIVVLVKAWAQFTTATEPISVFKKLLNKPQKHPEEFVVLSEHLIPKK